MTCVEDVCYGTPNTPFRNITDTTTMDYECVE
jgi:hypothetical protein